MGHVVDRRLDEEDHSTILRSMDLILWRHAEAGSWDHAKFGYELERPLNEKGQRQAKKMAKWLDKNLPERVKIFVSPAVRTQETAKALTTEFKTCPELEPTGSVDTILKTVGWPSNATHTVLLVGHQPWIGTVASFLLTGKKVESHIRKGSIWWFQPWKGYAGETALFRVLPTKDL